jgi:hypothetical protein
MDNGDGAMTDKDLYYLRSILRQLQTLKVLSVNDSSIPGEALADNINWLDCFIDKESRHEQQGC